MSTLKVDAIRHNSATSDAITTAADGTCTARITGMTGGGQLSHRRININGDMTVAQRATSASVSDGSNEGYSTVDRWYVLHSNSAGGVATWSQDSDVPTDYSWGRFSKSLKADVTTADTSIASNHAITLQYRIEAQDIRNSGWDYTNPNSTLSVSFWAKSVKAGIYCVALHTHDGTVADIVKEYTLVANTWKHVELEFPGNSGLTIDDNNGSGLTVLWALQVGSDRQLDAGTTWTTRSGEGKYGSSNQVNFYDSTDNNFYLTGVQIEVGKATFFEHRSFGEELSRCQRYCQVYVNPRLRGVLGSGGASDFHRMGMTLLNTLRTDPSATWSGTQSVYGGSGTASITGINSLYVDPYSFEIDGAPSGTLSGGAGTAVVAYTGGNEATLTLSAEL